ncbi:MAG: hypothetical protein HRT67_10540 [Flavobacteriaceae bacterium]|nr:hypothetical protein [Flavobacteriaceae bacterium]
MKHCFTLTFLWLSFAQTAFAQIGIGTDTPDASAALEISSSAQGLLLPRLTNTERNAITNPAHGLIIYNTDSSELQYNSNTQAAPIWLSASTSGKSLKYSNTDTTTDINQDTAINLPIFGTQNWNDNTALYTVNTTSNSVTINEAGRYRITVNASILNPDTNRRAPEMYISVNGVQASPYASTGYIRNVDAHNKSSLHISEVLQVSQNDVISVSTVVAGSSGASVTLRSANTSNIYIEKISDTQAY